MEAKYFKPRSVAWWASIGMIASGAFIAFDQLHGLEAAAAGLSRVYGGLSPAALINAGLLGLGLRGMNG